MLFATLVAMLAASAVRLPAQRPESWPLVGALPFANSVVGDERVALNPLISGIPELILIELSRNPAIRTVEPQRLRRAVSSQKLDAQGRLDDEAASHVGRILGAQWVIRGAFTGDGHGTIRIIAYMVDVATAQVTRPVHRVQGDREGFGRRALDVPAETVEAETVEQIRALQEAGGLAAYVKPHGALYHRASVDEECAAAIVSAIRAIGEELAVLASPGSALLAQAETAGLAAVPEGFVDRAYAPDGSLVPRGSPGAVLGVEDAVRQALAIARVRLDVRSLCLHGDTPGALELARRVVAELEAADIELRSFA